jgi:hypothetical protein
MLPGKIVASIEVLEDKSDCQMVFTDAQKIDEKGNVYPGTLLQPYSGFRNLLMNEGGGEVAVLHPENSFRLLFEENYIPTSSVVLRRSIFDKIGFFDEKIINSEDRDLWFRITKDHNICYLNRPLHQYRIRKCSLSNRGIITALYRIKVLEKRLAEGLPKSLSTKAHKLIADNYYGIGYHLREAGDMRKSREKYLYSLRHHFKIDAARGFFSTFLCPGILKILRRHDF